MNKQRWSIALVAASLLAAASSDVEAGKGKLRRPGGGGGLERGKNGVVFREKSVHTKGIRSRLTFGKLGKTLSVTNEQSAGGVKSTVQRRRQRVTKAVEGFGNGTKGESNFEKKNFFTRKWKSKMTRSDTVGDNEVTENASSRKVFRDWKANMPRRTGRMGNTEEFVNGQPRKASPTGKPFRGKLKGKRSIDRAAESMELADTQTRRWGVLRFLGNKKKRVSVEQRQTADGMRVTMTTPKAQTVRDTVVGDGVTLSTGTYSKKGRVRERDSVRITEQGGVRRTEKLRRDGTVKEVISERMTNDDRTRITRKKLRKDGSVRKIKEKESVIGPNGKRTARQRSRTTFRKNGSVRTNVGIGKVDGDRRANVKTPIGSLGSTQSRITSNSPGPAQVAPDDE